MRFRRLKIVSIVIIVIVLSVCVCVALVRKFVIPAPPGKHHACVDLSQTKTIDFGSSIQRNNEAIRLVQSTVGTVKM